MKKIVLFLLAVCVILFAIGGCKKTRTGVFLSEFEETVESLHNLWLLADAEKIKYKDCIEEYGSISKKIAELMKGSDEIKKEFSKEEKAKFNMLIDRTLKLKDAFQGYSNMHQFYGR